MEKFENVSQLYKGCDIVKIGECGRLEFSEFLMVHPNIDGYILALDSITQNANKIYIPKMIEEEYYVGKYVPAFVRTKKNRRIRI